MGPDIKNSIEKIGMKFEEYWYLFNILGTPKRWWFFNSCENYMWNGFVVWHSI